MLWSYDLGYSVGSQQHLEPCHLLCEAYQPHPVTCPLYPFVRGELKTYLLVQVHAPPKCAHAQAAFRLPDEEQPPYLHDPL